MSLPFSLSLSFFFPTLYHYVVYHSLWLFFISPFVARLCVSLRKNKPLVYLHLKRGGRLSRFLFFDEISAVEFCFKKFSCYPALFISFIFQFSQILGISFFFTFSTAFLIGQFYSFHRFSFSCFHIKHGTFFIPKFHSYILDVDSNPILFTTPPLGQDMTQGRFLSGV